MRPVRTASSNFVWTGPTADVGDLHTKIEAGPDYPITTSVWEPTPDERAAIAGGANIALRVLGIHPPVDLFITSEQGVGEDAPEFRERLRQLADSEAPR